MKIQSVLLAIVACAAASLVSAQSSSTSRRLTVQPASPTAFEPLTLSFDIIASCENVASFRLIEGGIRVELDGPTNEIFCDASDTEHVSLGAYPPGTYRIELGRTAAWGGTTHGTLDLVVRPGMTESASRFFAGGEDLSGLWFSPAEEPSTGMTFVHTGPSAPGARESLIGIWYRYGADGTARWYWIEGTTAQRRNFTGTVFAYREIDPTAPPAQRTVNATPIGTVQIEFARHVQPGPPARVTGTVEGEAVDFRLARFRWSRAAWPQVSP